MMKALNHMMIAAYLGVKNFIEDEKGAVDLVTIVVLIGIAVVLAGVFRKQIGDLLDKLFETITKNAGDAVKK